MGKPSISVIIPVYNCENELERCLLSVCGQTFSDIEILLINDGSSDQSGVICDSFAEKDPRIRVVHQKNSGVSAARNRGLDMASGTYIGFVDSDDYIEPNMYAHMYDKIRSSDSEIILCDPYVEKKGQPTVVDSFEFFPESRQISKSEITPIQLRYMAGSACRCLYRAELISANHLRFNEALPLSEDRTFNIAAFGCAERLYYLRQPLYHYVLRSASSTGKYRSDLFQLFLKTDSETVKVLETFWSPAFLPIYEKLILVDGAIFCIYQEFSLKCHKSLRSRINDVREIVENPRVHAAACALVRKNFRQKLLAEKRLFPLCLFAVLRNMKRAFLH